MRCLSAWPPDKTDVLQGEKCLEDFFHGQWADGTCSIGTIDTGGLETVLVNGH